MARITDQIPLLVSGRLVGIRLHTAGKELTDQALPQVLDREKWPGDISPLPAQQMHQDRYPPVSGKRVAEVYGYLAHYTRRVLLELLRAEGIGITGCWLTPIKHNGCYAPYELGVNSPRDVCLLIDVEGVELWGPGTSPPSTQFGDIWRGGGIEFFSPKPLDFSRVRKVVYPCPTCGR